MDIFKSAIVLGVAAIVCTVILALGPLRYTMTSRGGDNDTVIILDSLTGEVFIVVPNGVRLRGSVKEPILPRN